MKNIQIDCAGFKDYAFYFNVRASATRTDGGCWNSEFKNLWFVGGFKKAGMWFRGGVNGLLLPYQFNRFEGVEIYYDPLTYPGCTGLKMTEQNAQHTVFNCEIDGLKTVAGIQGTGRAFCCRGRLMITIFL